MKQSHIEKLTVARLNKISWALYETRMLTTVYRGTATGPYSEQPEEFEIYNLSQPNIIRMIRSRNVRLVGHAARMELWKHYTTVQEKNLHEKSTLKGNIKMDIF
jgi:hypothetical protein